MKTLSRRLHPLCVVVFLAVIILSCAKIAAPPGGPIDKTAPEIIATIPSADSIHVAGGNKITIVFSEDIDHKSIAGAVHISPRSEKEAVFKWKGQTLDIILPDSFADSTTYIVTLGAGIKDMRGNAMVNSLNFAFTTGDRIDQGQIAGLVFRDGLPASGANVGIFQYRDDSFFRYDSLYPVYLTQSGNDGRYELNFLPAGSYFALAFQDQNRNQKFDYPGESFGMPDRIALVPDADTGPRINFNLKAEDTLRGTAIIAATLALDYLVKIRLNRAIPPDTIAENLDKIWLERADSVPQKAVSALAIKETGEKGVNAFHAFFRNLGNGRYHVRLRQGFPGVLDTLEPISQPFDVRLSEDKTPPRLEENSHQNRGIFPSDSVITLQFSEPLASSDSLSALVTFTVDTLKLMPALMAWDSPFILNIHLSDLLWGKTVSMQLDMARLTDINGNPLGDTIKSFQFRLFDRDSLGEISGQIVRKGKAVSDGVVIISIRDIGGSLSLQRSFAADSFRVILPPGQYFLSGFIDKNGNGRFDPGSWNPRYYSETFSRYPDTVRVRYRFETAGLEFLLE